MCQRKAQHRHCFRLMDLQLSSVGTRKCTGTKRDSAGETKRIGSTMVESSVLFPVASVSSSEENGTSVVFSSSDDYYLIRQPMPPPSQSQGVSHVTLQKQNGTYWFQADRRVTVDDKSSANALAGFSSVHMAPIQEGGAASSSDVAVADRYRILQRLEESHKRPFLLNRDSRCEQSNQMRAKPIPETPTQRQRDVHALTHLPPFPWCPAWKSR